MSKKKKKLSRLGPRKKKKKKERRRRSNWPKPNPCALAHGHFCQSRKNASPPSFLPILGRKHFGGLRDKTLGTHPFFFPPLPQTKYLPKMFFFFFFFFFILPKIHPTKHTLSVFLAISFKLHLSQKLSKYVPSYVSTSHHQMAKWPSLLQLFLPLEGISHTHKVMFHK